MAIDSVTIAVVQNAVTSIVDLEEQLKYENEQHFLMAGPGNLLWTTSCLSSNYWGLGNPRAINFLCDLVRDYKSDIIFFFVKL